MRNLLRSLNPWPKCVICGRPAPTGSNLCLDHTGQSADSAADESSQAYGEPISGAVALSEVNCPFCAATNSRFAPFCTNCGSALPMPGDVDSGQSGRASGPLSREELQAEVNELRTVLRNASAHLLDLQRRINRLDPETPTAEPRAAPAAPYQVPPDVTVAAPEQTAVGAPADPAPSAPVVAPVLQTAPPAEAGGDAPVDGGGWLSFSPSIDWERILGRNWFAIIGAVALVVGIGFFLKLAFDNNWIGDTGRIVLGVVLGLALLGVGEYAQRRVPIWAQPVTAAGAVILYLSIYAAFGLYELIRPDVALLFLALVVALAALLALRYESIVIALLGIIGAFLAPALLGADLPDVRLALAYILVVDAGILAISTFRNWRWFNLVGWAGTYGVFFFWTSRFSDYDAVMAQIGLTGMFLILAAATSLFHLLWRRTPGIPDLALMTLNAVAFFALTYHVLWDDYQEWFGLIAIGLALFYSAVAFVAIRRPSTPAEMALFALPIAIVFLTIAVPLQLSGIWITVAWVAEGAALVGTALLLGRWQMRAFGLGVLAVGLGHLVVIDLLEQGGRIDLDEFVPFLNERFPIMTATVVALYAAAFLYHYYREQRERWEEFVFWPLLGIANALTVTALSLELVSYFDSRAVRYDGLDLLPFQFHYAQVAMNAKYLAMTYLWAIYGAAVIAVGLWRSLPLVRWAGLTILALAALKLMAFDTFVTEVVAERFLPFINVHFLAFVVAIALMVGFAWWYRRARPEPTRYEEYAVPALLIAANVVALWGLTLEAIHYFDARAEDLGTDTFGAQQLSLTVLWAVYAVGVMGVGIARQSSRIRLAGMALLAVPLVKLFGFDVFLLEREYRVAAFVTLGVLMLGTGLAYQRYSQAVRGFLFGQRA